MATQAITYDFKLIGQIIRFHFETGKNFNLTSIWFNVDKAEVVEIIANHTQSINAHLKLEETKAIAA